MTQSILPALLRASRTRSLFWGMRPKPNLLDINNVNPPLRLEIDQPILRPPQMAWLRDIARFTDGKFRSLELPCCYNYEIGRASCRERV